MLRRTLFKLTIVASAVAVMKYGPAMAFRQVTPVNLDSAFEDGSSFETEHFSGTLRVRQIAELVVTSGEIVACDALVWYGIKPFARQVAPGRYPVILTLAEFSNGVQRVAFARVQFRIDRPERWEMATAATQDLTVLQEGEIFGYPVDSGTGSFMDLDALLALEAMSASESEDFTETLIAEGEKNYIHAWDWMSTVLVPSTGVNQVAFASGVGDGYYASYWGYDTEDQIVCLVTDFGLIPASTT